MAVDLTQAKVHLNIDLTDTTDDAELQFFVDAANEWIATQVAAADLTAKPVQLGTLELVRHWWDSQRGPAGGVLDDSENWHLGLLGFAIPTRVRELIGPYRSSASTAAATGSFPDAPTWPDSARW